MAIEKEAIENNGNCFTSTTTPSSNETLCNAFIGPKFVVPIIIPGIMGSNIETLEGKEVWFPANGVFSGLGSAIYGGTFRSAKDRQTELDPNNTVVSNLGDIKIKKEHYAGISEETARARGWGTVWWAGYGTGLIFLERYLNKQLFKPLSANGQSYFKLDDFMGSEPSSSYSDTDEKDGYTSVISQAKLE